MSWAGGTWQDAAPEWWEPAQLQTGDAGLNLSPWGRERQQPQGSALELAGLGLQKAFGKRFGEHFSSPHSLSTRNGNQSSVSYQEAIGAAHSQHWKIHLPTLEASLAQSSPSHPGQAPWEGKAQEMWLRGTDPTLTRIISWPGSP